MIRKTNPDNLQASPRGQPSGHIPNPRGPPGSCLPHVVLEGAADSAVTGSVGGVMEGSQEALRPTTGAQQGCGGWNPTPAWWTLWNGVTSAHVSTKAGAQQPQAVQSRGCGDPQDPWTHGEIRGAAPPCRGKGPGRPLPSKAARLSLRSGFVYRPFSECVEFIQDSQDSSILKFQSGILLGLYSCVAIW